MMAGMSGGALAAEKQDSVTLGIYTTTDLHGKCYDLNPSTDKAIKNGYLNVATAIKEEREKNDYTLLLDNGDIIQGTPMIFNNLMFQGGEKNPMSLCLRYCGYEAVTLGNHEFNFSMEIQQKYKDYMETTDESVPGTPVELICANLINTETQESTHKPYTTRTYQVGGKDFKVGIIGFENVNVPNWDIPEHYEGCDFVHADNTERALAYEWTNNWQKILKEDEKCDFVIVLAHSGEGGDAVGDGDQGTVGEVSYEYSTENQVYHMVQNTTGIDLMVAGHNHTKNVTYCNNAEGKTIPVVNGGSTEMTKTMVTINADGTFTIDSNELMDLTVYESDAGLKELMTPYYESALDFVTEEIGTLAGDWDEERDLFHVQSDTMNLVQEAQLWATDADISLASPVANKDFCIKDLLADGTEAPISTKDCYQFYKYDNNLMYAINITGKQVREWLEKCCQDYTVQADGTITGGGFGTDQLYGISYDIYMGNPVGDRVRNMTFNGEPVQDDQVFRCALNSYRLAANEKGDAYGWFGITGITTGTEAVVFDGQVSEQFGAIGGSMTLVIAEYLKSLTAAGEKITPPEAKSTWALHTGYSEDMADAAVTRLDFVNALYTAAGTPEATTEAAFSDVETATAALNWAAETGVVEGSEGAFMPDAPVTREQAVTMLYRYDVASGKGPEGSWAVQIPYTDLAQISEWVGDAAMWNVIRDYISADENGAFAPKTALTYTDLAAVLAKLG